MNLSELQREAHAIAKSKGWRDEERTFGNLIAEVHSKLSKALEAYREHGLEPWGLYPYIDTPYDEPPPKPEGVAYELADVVIRVADMAEYYGLDLAAIIQNLLEDTSPIDMSCKTFGDWLSVCHAAFSMASVVREHATYFRPIWEEHFAEACHLVQRMATYYGIDLDAAIEAKTEYNKTRPYRHGGKAL